MNSKQCRGIQFSDMLAGIIQSRFEDQRFDEARIIAPVLRLKSLFFRA